MSFAARNILSIAIRASSPYRTIWLLLKQDIKKSAIPQLVQNSTRADSLGPINFLATFF